MHVTDQNSAAMTKMITNEFLSLFQDDMAALKVQMTHQVKPGFRDAVQ